MMIPHMATETNASNISSFYGSITASSKDPKSIGTQFEAMFYRMMFEQIRSDESEDPLMSSSQGKQIRAMWQDELAGAMAQQGQLGIQDLISKEVERLQGALNPADGLLKESI